MGQGRAGGRKSAIVGGEDSGHDQISRRVLSEMVTLVVF